MFARLAPSYDRFNSWATGGLVHQWHRATVKLACPQPGQRFLDLACGTGEMALHLAARGEQVLAVDFCPQMLAQASSKAKARGRAGKVHLVLGNARRLPFPNDSFDGITIGFALRNLADLAGGLAEVARVLRPGGHLACLEAGRADAGWARPLYRLYFTQVVPRLGRWISHGQEPAFRYLVDSVNGFLAPEELLRSLRAAGLRQVSYRRLHAGLITLYHGVK